MKTTRLLFSATFAAVVAGTSGVASAQATQGYWTAPAAGGAVWRNAFGQCWRASYWTPAMASAECDPGLAPKPAPKVAPPPPPPPAPKPAAKPAAKPKVLSITSTELFGFNSSTLSKEAQAKLDKEVIARTKEFAVIRFINVSGHTDRLGSAQYNQKLSERRAEAVKRYMVSRGFDTSKIETYGFGKTTPVKSCPDVKSRKALIECLAPNRRVVVDIQGTPR